MDKAITDVSNKEMTPKEKAKALIDKLARFDGYDDSIDLSTCYEEKLYALIAANEILEVISKHYDDGVGSEYKYWKEVKAEIKKL